MLRYFNKKKSKKKSNLIDSKLNNKLANRKKEKLKNIDKKYYAKLIKTRISTIENYIIKAQEQKANLENKVIYLKKLLKTNKRLSSNQKESIKLLIEEYLIEIENIKYGLQNSIEILKPNNLEDTNKLENLGYKFNNEFKVHKKHLEEISSILKEHQTVKNRLKAILKIRKEKNKNLKN